MVKKQSAIRTVYWDACVFISLFDGGKGRTVEELDNLNFWAQVIDDKEAFVHTSLLTLTEVLDARIEGGLNPVQYEAFDKFVHSQHVELYEVGLGAIKGAKSFREQSINQGLRPKLRVPDAIHLATAAIITGCTEFHTFDGSGSKPGLIHLDGQFIGVPKICTPQKFQRSSSKMGNLSEQDELFKPQNPQSDDANDA
jgi:predicted nucleic acid-binding protein